MTPELTEAPSPSGSQVHVIAMAISLLIIPVNCVIYFIGLSAARGEGGMWLTMFAVLCVGQLITGIVALIAAIRYRMKFAQGGIAAAIFGSLSALGAIAGFVSGFGLLLLGSMGGAWGRPLRVRGKQLHPELKAGSDWTRGDRPNPAGLDEASRKALEALWLHDAQKEHASVPAFSRVSWMLAAAGAPAELLEWAHRAALEEIEHTRLCFALAAGYGGRSFSVEPMPDLLLGGLDVKGNALVVLATESLGDGCQLEDYNADVAAACASACEEPVTKNVLNVIAREERTHADFSWAVVEWLLKRDYATVAAALEQALAKLSAYPRPTAVGRDKLKLWDAADPAAMRKHGRLPDSEWARMWDERLVKTQARLKIALEAHRPAGSAVYAGATQVRSATDLRA